MLILVGSAANKNMSIEETLIIDPPLGGLLAYLAAIVAFHGTTELRRNYRSPAQSQCFVQFSFARLEKLRRRAKA